MVELSEDFFTSLRPSKHFPWTTEQSLSTSITTQSYSVSLDFDSTGKYLVTACAATDSIHLFACEDGENEKVIFSKKYGVGQVKFAHRSTTVIYTSTKGEDSKTTENV